MEVLQNDAFNPGAYKNHVPTEQLAKNKDLATTLLLIGCLVAVGLVIYVAIEEGKKKSSGSGDLTLEK